MKTIKDELEEYQVLWDAALDKMKDWPTSMPKTSPAASFSGEYSFGDTSSNDEPSPMEMFQERRRSSNKQLDIYDMLVLSENIDRVFHPERLKENKEELVDVATKAASSPNPIQPTSVGKDQDMIITQDFSDGKALRELHDLKVKLEEMERKVHAAAVDGTEKQENSLNKEIASLRLKVEELCDKLTPHIYLNPN